MSRRVGLRGPVRVAESVGREEAVVAVGTKKSVEPVEVVEGDVSRVASFSYDADGNPVPGQVLIEASGE